MRVVVLEDYLNYAASSACIEPLKKPGDVICHTEEDYRWNFIPVVEIIIAFMEGRPRNLAVGKVFNR